LEERQSYRVKGTKKEGRKNRGETGSRREANAPGWQSRNSLGKKKGESEKEKRGGTEVRQAFWGRRGEGAKDVKLGETA